MFCNLCIEMYLRQCSKVWWNFQESWCHFYRWKGLLIQKLFQPQMIFFFLSKFINFSMQYWNVKVNVVVYAMSAFIANIGIGSEYQEALASNYINQFRDTNQNRIIWIIFKYFFLFDITFFIRNRNGLFRKNVSTKEHTDYTQM